MIFMGIDQTNVTVKVLLQSRAVLDPVSAVHVNQVVHRTDLGMMDVPADDSPDAVLASIS